MALEHSLRGGSPEGSRTGPKPPQGTMQSDPSIGYSHIVASRATVRKVQCPRCQAEPGMRCWRVKRSGVRYRGPTNHIERVKAYEQA